MTLDSSGKISGKTDATGDFNLTIKVTDTSSPSKTATKSFTLKIASSDNSDLIITTNSLFAGTTGIYYLRVLNASGGQTPYTWSLESGSLPTGLTLDSNGRISGKADSVGDYNLTVKVTDTSSPQKTATKTFTLKVIPACEKLSGSGSIGIVLVARNPDPTSNYICSNSKEWDTGDFPFGSDPDWYSVVNNFSSFLDSFPPFTSADFSLYRSNVFSNPNVCEGISETVYIMPCSGTEFRSNAFSEAHKVFLAYDLPIGGLAHELGHSFAGLCDEYVRAGRPQSTSCANCCADCPSSCPHFSACYEGCDYQTTGLYRDTENSIMRSCYSVGCSFGPVNTAIINQKLGK